MSSLILFTFALFVIVFAALARIARRPAWSRLVLVAVLTLIFDRPGGKRPVRARGHRI